MWNPVVHLWQQVLKKLSDVATGGAAGTDDLNSLLTELSSQPEKPLVEATWTLISEIHVSRPSAKVHINAYHTMPPP
jgi:hypothetical protein